MHDWLIDWFVFSTNFSSISAISWREHILYISPLEKHVPTLIAMVYVRGQHIFWPWGDIFRMILLIFQLFIIFNLTND
jgi:hypothetical protein